MFNAVDVLFGSLDPLAGDIPAATQRDQTAWLASAYLPLGAFSFQEAAALQLATRPRRAWAMT